MTFFDQLAARRSDEIAALDAAKFAPAIRNHLLQLFRKAHAKDHALEGLAVGMGAATAKGRYLLAARDDEGNLATAKALDWEYGAGAPMYQEVSDFFTAAKSYSDRISARHDDLPYIADITLADIETRGMKKAKIHGPRGLCVKLAKEHERDAYLDYIDGKRR